MTTLDLTISGYYNDPNDASSIMVILEPTDETLVGLFNASPYAFPANIGIPANHSFSIFSSVQDGMEFYTNVYKNSMISFINNVLGTSYTLGTIHQVLHQTVLDALAAKQDIITTGTSSQYMRGDLTLATSPALSAVATSGAYPDLSGKPTIPSAQVNSDWSAGSGLAQILNKPTLPNTTRTTSALTLSLVGTGATGTQISSTKDSTVRVSVSTSTTSTIGGPATSVVYLKTCATNDATEANWTSYGPIESDQTITLAVVLQSIQVVKGQLCADIPAGYYVKLVASGTGTHSETFIAGSKTIYG